MSFLLDPDSRFIHGSKIICLYFQKKQKIHLSLNNEKWILINFYKIVVIDPGNPFKDSFDGAQKSTDKG